MRYTKLPYMLALLVVPGGSFWRGISGTSLLGGRTRRASVLRRFSEADMADPVDALIVDLLEWIGPKQRPYSEVIEAWRTSCPRLPVWEESNGRGFVERRHQPGSEAMISVTALGREFLRKRRSKQLVPG
jgi:hypothetical protein